MALPFSSAMGVNYSNSFQSNPIPDATAVADIRNNGITPVKLFNYTQTGFFAAATGLELIPGIPNSELNNLYNNNTSAVVNALKPYASQIKAIMVGNEPLLDKDASTYGPLLAKSLTNLDTALKAAGMNIPLSIPLNSNVESVSWPPSAGAFKSNYK